jgi:hypothetical protein
MSACAGTQTDPIHRMPHRSQKNAHRRGASFGVFSETSEPVEVTNVSYRGTAREDKMSLSIRDFSSHRQRRQTMVITSAHIQPIVALIAGVVILIMPRFLNLVVAIYLIFIGLAGLGLFKMFHI